MRKAACGCTMPRAELLSFASRRHQNCSYHPLDCRSRVGKKPHGKTLCTMRLLRILSNTQLLHMDLGNFEPDKAAQVFGVTWIGFQTQARLPESLSYYLVVFVASKCKQGWPETSCVRELWAHSAIKSSKDIVCLSSRV